MQKVYITDVILRDAHQSLIATRLRTEDMLPILAKVGAGLGVNPLAPHLMPVCGF